MVKRAVGGSERPIWGSSGQLEDLRGHIDGQKGSQRVWEASPGVGRVKVRNVETNTQISP